MQIVRKAIWFSWVLLCVCLTVSAQQQSIRVTGKLVRSMGIGGESTGWLIEAAQSFDVNGKQVSSIEVDSHDARELQQLENKEVEATGQLSHRAGIERNDRVVLDISFIKELAAQPDASELTGIWRLEELNGHPALQDVQATLEFMAEGRAVGRASCNRFFGSVEISGHSIRFGTMGSTRMACAESVMKQEAEYLKALAAAERFELKDSELLIYSKGFEKPLRFAKVPAA